MRCWEYVIWTPPEDHGAIPPTAQVVIDGLKRLAGEGWRLATTVEVSHPYPSRERLPLGGQMGEVTRFRPRQAYLFEREVVG